MERPGVGLCVILMNRSDEVLLGKRKGDHGGGLWAFPGGHLEHFEEFEDCAIRELQEETGLENIDNYKILDYRPSAITNDFFHSSKKHYITLFIRAEYKSGEIKNMEPDKCEEWKWFKWDNFPNLLFVPVRNLRAQGYNPFTKEIVY